MVEHSAVNRVVARSSRAGGAKIDAGNSLRLFILSGTSMESTPLGVLFSVYEYLYPELNIIK